MNVMPAQPTEKENKIEDQFDLNDRVELKQDEEPKIHAQVQMVNIYPPVPQLQENSVNNLIVPPAMAPNYNALAESQ